MNQMINQINYENSVKTFKLMVYCWLNVKSSWFSDI